MNLVDLHIHTRRSHHGEGDMLDYVEKAIEQNYSVIAFNEHAPYLFDHKHRLSLAELNQYIIEGFELKNAFKDQIDILIGLEVDYHPRNHSFILNMLENIRVDFCSGAIHFLNFDNRNLSVWDYDLFYDSKNIDLYFELLESIVKSKLFTHIVHPDIILRSGIDSNNLIEKFESLFLLMRKSNIGYEINCSGRSKKTYNQGLSSMVPKYGSYPCYKYIELATDTKVPLVIGSDAHSVELLGANIPEVCEHMNNESILSIYNFLDTIIK